MKELEGLQESLRLGQLGHLYNPNNLDYFAAAETLGNLVSVLFSTTNDLTYTRLLNRILDFSSPEVWDILLKKNQFNVGKFL